MRRLILPKWIFLHSGKLIIILVIVETTTITTVYVQQTSSLPDVNTSLRFDVKLNFGLECRTASFHGDCTMTQQWDNRTVLRLEPSN